jgi:hypothetical protein
MKEQARILSSSVSLVWLGDPSALDLKALLLSNGSSVIAFGSHSDAPAEANRELHQSMGYVHFYNINAANDQALALKRIVQAVNLTLQGLSDERQ